MLFLAALLPLLCATTVTAVADVDSREGATTADVVVYSWSAACGPGPLGLEGVAPAEGGGQTGAPGPPGNYARARVS